MNKVIILLILSTFLNSSYSFAEKSTHGGILAVYRGDAGLKFLNSPDSYISDVTAKPHRWVKTTAYGEFGVDCYTPGFFDIVKEIREMRDAGLFVNKNMLVVKVLGGKPQLCTSNSADWCEKFGPTPGALVYEVIVSMETKDIKIQRFAFCSYDRRNTSPEDPDIF